MNTLHTGANQHTPGHTRFKATVRNDQGKDSFALFATGPEQAKQVICRYLNCPEGAITLTPLKTKKNRNYHEDNIG